jgi:hypothetical protein
MLAEHSAKHFAEKESSKVQKQKSLVQIKEPSMVKTGLYRTLECFAENVLPRLSI